MSLDQNLVTAAENFDSKYKNVFSFKQNTADTKTFLGLKTDVCRFCKKGREETSFKKEAHAVPHSLGNTRLFSNYECDSCNNLFSMAVEDDLGKFLLPSRVFTKIKGKKGFPKIKTKEGSRIGPEGNELKISQFKNDQVAKVDKEKITLDVNLESQPFIKLNVYKCFLKIALTVMPEDDLDLFKDAIKFIQEEPKKNFSFRKVYFCLHPRYKPTWRHFRKPFQKDRRSA